MFLKRLWDVKNKRTAWVEGPSGQNCQIWVDVNTNKMYIYNNSQWIEYTQSIVNDGKTYGRNWVVIDSDDEMGVYDTDSPTDLFTWEEGDEVSYVFKDWDGTVLKEGKIAEGTAPTPPADPTREATAQYTYTFTGWNPTVGNITKKTTYTATYTSTVNQYTITFVDEDGTTELDEQTLDYGATPVYEGETPTKQATAQYTYTFSGWTPAIAAVTGNATYTATYTATLNECDLYITPNNISYGSVSMQGIGCYYGDSLTVNGATITATRNTFHDTVSSTATANAGYTFSGFTYNGSPLTGTVTITRRMNITAVFVEETPPASGFNITVESLGEVEDGDGEPVEMPYILGFGDGDSITAVAAADPMGNGSYLTLSWNNGANVEVFHAISQYSSGREIVGDDIMIDNQTYTITDETTINEILVAAIGLEGDGATIDDEVGSINARIGDSIEISGNTLTIGEETVTATPINGNTGIDWLDGLQDPLPAQVSIDDADNCIPETIVAYGTQAE